MSTECMLTAGERKAHMGEEETAKYSMLGKGMADWPEKDESSIVLTSKGGTWRKQRRRRRKTEAFI